MMYKALGIAAAVAVFALMQYMMLDAAFEQGISEGAAAQAKADRKAYAEVLEKINEGTIDVGDPTAINRELCRLAGVADSAECGDM